MQSVGVKLSSVLSLDCSRLCHLLERGRSRPVVGLVRIDDSWPWHSGLCHPPRPPVLFRTSQHPSSTTTSIQISHNSFHPCSPFRTLLLRSVATLESSQQSRLPARPPPPNRAHKQRPLPRHRPLCSPPCRRPCARSSTRSPPMDPETESSFLPSSVRSEQRKRCVVSSSPGRPTARLGRFQESISDLLAFFFPL